MTDVFALTPTNQADVMAGFDAVDADEALKDAASAFASHEHADVLGPLRELGVMAGSEEAREHGMAANTFTPRHHAVDRFGARTDAVEFHPSWHWLMRRGVEFGLAGAPWQDASADAHLRRAAGFITWSGVEPGHVCPLTMTHAAVPALRADEALTQRYADGLAASVYEPGDLPAASKEGLLAGMGMTEKQGGSDVRTNVTEATPSGFDDDGAAVYSLRGHKWFTSAPTNDLFLVLAQAPGGLTCFVVPRVHPDGTRNALRIVRLKDKLGNRSNASSELEFHDAYATRLGDEGAGVRTIIEMVSATRLDCVLGSAGLMRRATSEAAWYTARRHAFGGVLADKPAMQNVLADLAIESEAATALGMRLAASVERASEHPLALAIVAAAGKRGIATGPVADFDSPTGKGALGTVEGRRVALGNAAFLQDPIRSICGPVIFVDAEGEDKTIDAVIESVEQGIRAVKNYREDNPEEYTLWRAAVINSTKSL